MLVDGNENVVSSTHFGLFSQRISVVVTLRRIEQVN